MRIFLAPSVVLRLLRRFLAERAGAAAAMSALMMPTLIGFTGLAVDVGYWYAEKARLQTVADAAALGGAWELRRSGSTEAEIERAAEDIAARNGFSPGADASLRVSSDRGNGTVTAEARRQAPLFFSRLFLGEAPVIAARAVALVNPPPACLLALEPSREAMTLSGNGSVTAEGCAIHLNSTAPSALSASGNASVAAAAICVGGGYRGRAGAYSPEPLMGCLPHADPFAGLPVPASPRCSQKLKQISGKKAVHLEPCVYEGGISISGQAEVTFAPGIYVIEDDGLSTSGGSRIAGEGVTFVLTGDAEIDMSGDTEVALSAPTSGATAGILFYQNPAEPGAPGHRLSGGHNSRYDGVLYLPNSEVTFTGNSTAEAMSASASMIVAQSFTFSGNGRLRIAPGDDIAAANAIPVTLVE